jgi:AraC-like DNA-binding protein
LLLLAGEGNATAVAFGVGYESPNQFSREYARQFGLPPSRDAALLRRGYDNCLGEASTVQLSGNLLHEPVSQA